MGRAWMAFAACSALTFVSCAEPGDDAANLAEAVDDGDRTQAARLLDEGADPDEPRINGFTPLMRAAIRDDVEMAAILLDGGADPAATAPEGLTAPHLAAQVDATAVLALLLDAGADPGRRSSNGMNVFEHAAAAGSTGALALLAPTVDDLNARSRVVSQGHGYPIDRGSTALGLAVRSGQFGAVRWLLEAGADVDAPSESGNTPLLIAVYSAQSGDLVNLLLDAGADPAAVGRCVERCAHPDGDALAWADRLGRTELADLLRARTDG